MTFLVFTCNFLGRRLYWGDLSGKIEESWLDGRERIVLVNDSLLQPHAITACLTSRRLYWLNAHNNYLEAYM